MNDHSNVSEKKKKAKDISLRNEEPSKHMSEADLAIAN
jgi:hypothetical protein